MSVAIVSSSGRQWKGLPAGSVDPVPRRMILAFMATQKSKQTQTQAQATILNGAALLRPSLRVLVAVLIGFWALTGLGQTRKKKAGPAFGDYEANLPVVFLEAR